ncbi:MAG: sensor signal transduction histidine kinase [Vampirovibrio sp.]|nr:sensor signal transduction histidine kinase [Vampirovibrio sp.]
MESPSVYSTRWKPFYNKLAQGAGILIVVIGLIGVCGYLLNYPVLLTIFESTPPIAVLTAVSYIFLGIAVITVLDTQPYENRPSWLWPVRWTSILMSGFIGLLCLTYYLNLAEFNIPAFVFLRREGPIIPTIMTSSRILLSSVAILLFLTLRHRASVVVYGIGSIGLYLIYTSLLSFAGHWLDLPRLYHYMISILSSVGFVLLGSALLVSTLPYEGLLLPLLSKEFKSRLLTGLVFLMSLLILAYGVSMVAVTSHFMSAYEISHDISFLYVGVETATVLAAMFMGLISLRAIHYRNESLYMARLEAQAARAMKHSEERLRRLVDSNILGVFYWRLNGEVLEANDAYLHMLGYSRDDLKAGRINWQNTIPSEDHALQEQMLVDLKAQRVVQPKEKEYQHTDGSRVNVVAAFAMFEDSADSGIGFILNITELKQVKQELQEQLSLNKTITDNATSVFCLLDSEGMVLFWNPMGEAITGYTADELKGKRLHDIVHHTYPDGTPFPFEDCPVNRTLKRGEQFQSLETFWIRKDGTYLPIRWTVSSLGLRGGISSFLLEVCDISTEKHFAREVETIKYALNVSAIVDITDANGNFTFVNDAFCKVTKYFSQELLGKNINLLDSGYHSSEFFSSLWSTVQQGRIWTGEFCNKAKDGSIFWVYTTIVPYMGEDGASSQYIAIRYDITERKRMEQLLMERERVLNLKNQELDQFVTFASHDLKTPLRKIKNMTGFLQSTTTAGLTIESLDFLKRIQSSVDYMDGLIDDLLQLARSSKETISITPIDMPVLITQTLAELVESIESSHAQIDVDAVCTIHGDKMQLQLLFKNLIENAIKFHKPGVPPVIKISAKQKDDMTCEIQVRDNGIGFEQQYAERIFLAFERLHGKSEYSGTGVGLAICQKIVERHHGSISAHSEPGEGTLFVVRLPLSPDVEMSEQAATPSGQANAPIVGADAFRKPTE